ncbi:MULTISPECIES: hypothetical protein [unclassified Microcoleus]|uniref:hypothetical protein n=1 Tax=unclassified Microcoleus TaxID=2642155 RepID=UPI002FD47AEF
MKIFYLVLAGLQFFIGLEKFGIEKKGIDDIEGRRKKEEGRRKKEEGRRKKEEGRRKFVGFTMRTG